MYYKKKTNKKVVAEGPFVSNANTWSASMFSHVFGLWSGSQ